MTKELLERKYSIEESLLSARAKNILEDMDVHSLDDFCNVFLEKPAEVDLSGIKNCGLKTQLELENFIKSIKTEFKSIFPQKKLSEHDELDTYYEERIDRLSTRTKNTLRRIGADSFKGFYVQVLQVNHVDAFLLKVRNCGKKTIQDLLLLRDEMVLIINQRKSSDSLPKIESIVFNFRAEHEFNQEFNKLSNRGKNILKKIGADTIKGFYFQVLQKNEVSGLFLSGIKNCGLKTLQEFELFCEKIERLIIEKKDDKPSIGLFNEIFFFLFETDIFNKKEKFILLNRFCISEGFLPKNLADIGQELGITRERTRQITLKVQNELKKKIKWIIKDTKFEIKNYFLLDFFSVDREFADRINDLEKTNFQPGFITFILESCQFNGYLFIKTKDHFLPNYSGVFVKKSIAFDFKGCFESLLKWKNTQRNENIEININKLINSFKKLPPERFEAGHEAEGANEKEQIAGVLKLFIENISDNQDEVYINSENIVFERTTKKLKYEYLVDILRDFNRPLHHSELEAECKRRGINDICAMGHLLNHPDIFGLKGPGTYGLIEWGGYFGTIGDVAEQLLKENNGPMDRKKLMDKICRELYVSQDSVPQVLFHYSPERRFVRLRNNKIGLREWL